MSPKGDVYFKTGGLYEKSSMLAARSCDAAGSCRLRQLHRSCNGEDRARHDREAPAMRPRPRGLDGRIEAEDVSLRDKEVHGAQRPLYASRGVHAGGRLIGYGRYSLPRAHDDEVGLGRTARQLLHAATDLGEAGRDLLDVRGLSARDVG